MNRIRMAFLVMGLSRGVLAQAETLSFPQAAHDAYLDFGEKIENELAKPIPSREQLIRDLDLMLEQSIPVVQAFAGFREVCTAQLNQLLLILPEIRAWSSEDIRINIEIGKALPKATGCYPARDIIAHPAIVRAFLLNTITRIDKKQLLDEMVEAIEHMQEIGELLSKP